MREIKAIKREDGLYNIIVNGCFVGTVMLSQLEKALRIAEKNQKLDNFYSLLYR